MSTQKAILNLLFAAPINVSNLVALVYWFKEMEKKGGSLYTFAIVLIALTCVNLVLFEPVVTYLFYTGKYPPLRYFATFLSWAIHFMVCVALSYLVNEYINTGEASTSKATFGFFVSMLQINLIYTIWGPGRLLFLRLGCPK